MTQKFTPRPHQLAAVTAISTELKASDRTTAVMACGSGKTLVALWVAEQMDAKTILVLLPSLALIAQTLKEWRERTKYSNFYPLCVCSDNTVADDEMKINPSELDFQVTTKKEVIKRYLGRYSPLKIIFSTYQSADLIPNDFKFDLGIFDEAHKTAGQEDGLFSYALSNENVNISKRLFMTATPRHFDVNKIDKHGEKIAAYSMDNESIYGKVCYKLSFSDAVKQNIICGYKIIISTLTSDDINRSLIHHGVMNIKKNKFHAKSIANILSLDNAIKVNDIKKVFTFHKTVKDAKTFSTISNSLLLSKNFKSMHINGGMNSVERKSILDEFKHSDAAVLSNARCLTEGVDVPAVDMVAFMSPKKSQIDIIQAAGRAMRKYNGKVQGYILIPIFLETNKQENFEEALNDTKYHHIWNILQALQEYDDELLSIITDLQKSSVRKTKIDYERLNKKIGIVGVASSLHIKTLRSAIITKVIDKLTNTWDERFEELLIFKEKYGHVNVPQNNKYKSLGQWASDQRLAFNSNILPKNRIDKLNEIGFCWNLFKDAWDKKFKLLVNFKNKHGHLKVSDSSGLVSWVRKQREFFASNTLPKDRVDKLESIGFSWIPQIDTWNEYFEKLSAFKTKFGHTAVTSTSKKYVSLFKWVSRQRTERKKNILNQERIDRLNSIGFAWHGDKGQTWEQQFGNLLLFMAKHGHPNPCQKDMTFKGLSTWICKQRVDFKNNILPQDKIDKLNAIGFSWNARDVEWNKNFKKLLDYKEKYGHINIKVSKKYREKGSLSNWVNSLRTCYKRKTLSKDKIDKLNAIGFEWIIYKKDTK